MRTGTWYRGAHLQRRVVDSKWSETWKVDDKPQVFTWNEAIRFVDENTGATSEEIAAAHYECCNCGHLQIRGSYVKEMEAVLGAHAMCFTCNHWREWDENHARQPDRFIVVDGIAYYIAPPSSDPMRFKGHGGTKFRVVFNDGSTAETSNLWCNGDISAEWRERLPDTARLERG